MEQLRSGALLRPREALESEIALRAPEASLCLTSALSLHDLTDVIPFAIDVALPRSRRPPRVSAPVRWHRFHADTFFVGRWETLAIARQAALDAAYAAHPERFVRGRPIVARPPNEVAINPVEPETPTVTAADLLAGRHEMQIPPQPPTAVPELVLPGAVPAANHCS